MVTLMVTTQVPGAVPVPPTTVPPETVTEDAPAPPVTVKPLQPVPKVTPVAESTICAPLVLPAGRSSVKVTPVAAPAE